jgi:sugar phosphate isomerase/epimerase
MVLDPKMRAYERALNPALHGCETFDFAPTDLRVLRERVRVFSAFSVHSPLPTPPNYPGRAVTSFLLDPDLQKRRASLEMLQHTIQVAAEWGALYVVVHFAGLHSDGISRASVVDLADDTAAQLNAWAEQVDLPLHLEYAAYNPSFATPQDLIASVSRHPYLHVCLDIGHVRVGAEILGLDEWDVVRMLAPYTGSMHLWTSRGREDVRRYHHVPVHPLLTPVDGWIDVPGMLKVVLAHNPDCAIVFEPNTLYNPDLDWQAEGVAWVRGLVASYGGRYGQPAVSPLETRVAGSLGSVSPGRE